MISTDRLRADLDNAAAGTPVAAPDIPSLIGGGRRRRRQRRALLAGAAAVAVVAVAAGAGVLATPVGWRATAPVTPAASPTGTSKKPLTAVPRPPASLVRVAGFDVAAWPSLGVAYDRTHHRYRYFPHSYALPAPVGTRIVLLTDPAGGGPQTVSMYDTATGTSRPIPLAEGSVGRPTWSPDGSKLAFAADDKTSTTTPTGLVVVDAATLTPHTVMLPWSQSPIEATVVQWTPDGAHLVAGVLARGSSGTIDHLQLFTVDGTAAGVVPATAWAPAASAWSPDRSRFVSYNDTTDKSTAIYAVFDATSGAIVSQLPVPGDYWWLDGSHLLLFNSDAPAAVSEVDTNGADLRDYPVPVLSTAPSPDLLLYPHR
jgi:hypothetical protein